MRIFTLILMVLALGLMIFNLTQVNWSSPFEENSIVAVITSLALACAVLLLLILRTSKKIEATLKNKS